MDRTLCGLVDIESLLAVPRNPGPERLAGQNGDGSGRGAAFAIPALLDKVLRAINVWLIFGPTTPTAPRPRSSKR